ncbi:hypothetical protein [Allorhodopirellula heiligendammensis]|uniref:Uncharacterized protein n=1 Tax=Allorhodopirellula heiligendammensis TaxID=2714739 RepID=A0A5C6C1C2_9BACT|nr:hypothetical protein [Allorhodopirellula heiligendammensis]TWU17932.1 hypothetical protein Poly21_00840 [Allorhodopirellula heiligendammensis]
MESKSTRSLLNITLMLTIALVGLSARWDRIGYIAPLGNTDLAPFLFLPLLIAAIHGGMQWFGFRLSLPAMATRAAALIALATCLIVVSQLPATFDTKVMISLIVVAFVVTAQVIWMLVPSNTDTASNPHDGE